MERQYQYNEHSYWVKVEPVVNEVTGQHAGYMAWVNDEQPSVFFYGQVVKDEGGQPRLFGDKIAALLNANATKQSELER